MAKNLGKFLFVLLAMSSAQAWAGETDVDYINARSFSIPMVISGGQKDKIKELELFVSTDEGKTWTRTSVIAPERGGFTYTALTDGVYWFRVCTVDKMDNREPKDIYKSDKTSKILVDTLPPTLRIARADRQGENIVVAWEIQELNPDLTSFKLEYKTQDGYWYPVNVSPAMSGQGQFRSPQNGPVTVRIKFADLAGNQAPAEAEVAARAEDFSSSLTTTSMQIPSGSQVGNTTPAPSFPAATTPVQSAPNPSFQTAPNPPYVAPRYEASVPLANPVQSNPPPAPVISYGSGVVQAPSGAAQGPNWNAAGQGGAAQGSYPGGNNGGFQGQGAGYQGASQNPDGGSVAAQRNGYQGTPAANTSPVMTINSTLPPAPRELVMQPSHTEAVRVNWQQPNGQQQGANLRQADDRKYEDRNWAPAAPPPPSGGIGLPPGNPAGYVATRTINNMQTHVTNSTQITLNYKVNHVGPSGVGSVDLYLTEDEGRTWRRYAEDTDLQPPMVVNLPGEGVFGLRLIVTSKAGLGRRPPQEGDLPEMRVEVDSTTPVVKLFRPEPDSAHRDAVILTWQASDRNLATSPITLQYAERTEGPWQTIATELTNSGRYVWHVGPNMGRVYLRVVARDMAGNQGFDESADPILVDLTEPDAKILGISSGVRQQ